MPVVNALYRYPVKSMAGERLETLNLGPRGVPGDRAWAVRDEERGGIRGGKRLPDGSELAINDPRAPDELSALTGSPVTIWPLLPEDQLDHYRRGAPVLDDGEAEFRRIFGRTADEPLPDLSRFPEFLMEFESPPGTYFDAFPLLVMTTESLEHLAEAAPDHRFDVSRFRPNLLIEAGSGQPFPERDWIGRRLKIGSAEIEVAMGCPRCVMTTHAHGDLPKDPGVMRALVNLADGDLGVYANVTTPGQVRVGDSIEIN